MLSKSACSVFESVTHFHRCFKRNSADYQTGTDRLVLAPVDALLHLFVNHKLDSSLGYAHRSRDEASVKPAQAFVLVSFRESIRDAPVDTEISNDVSFFTWTPSYL